VLIKAIIFDFDGVIIESADIKTEAFKELFSGYPEKLTQMVDYHLMNAGISRYIKFRYIYESILQKELSRKEEAELGKRFSQIVLEKVLNAPFVAGAKEFLDENRDRYELFVASGTPEVELRNIVHARGLQGHFKGIYGSPREKTDIINAIMQEGRFRKNEVAYIGDAPSDRVAARQAHVFFIERKTDLDLKSKKCFGIIKDLRKLDAILRKVEKLKSRRGD